MGQFESSSPIYLQIVEKICYQIVRKELRPGDKLLSVREMAIKMGVNPNTIQRTYTELERMAIVETRRGQGTFVRDDMETIEQLKNSLQTKIIETFVTNMQQLGASKTEIKESLKEFLERSGGDGK